MRKNLFTTLSILGALAISPLAHATLLGLPTLTAGALPVAPTNIATGAPGAGATIAGTLNLGLGEAFTATSALGGIVTGTLYETVYKEATGTLDFYYQVKVLTSVGGKAGGKSKSPDTITELDVENFFGYSNSAVGTETAFTLDSKAGTKGNPNAVSLDITGAQYTWGFAGLAPTGSGKSITPASSLTMVISTTAKTFDVFGTGALDISGSSGSGIAGFSDLLEPSSVPEPVSIILGGSVLSLSALWIRRRRRAVEVKA